MAKQVIYRHILGALVDNEPGLTQPALVVWVKAGNRHVSKKNISAYLQRFRQVKWVMLEAGVWKATELGKQAYARNFLLGRALQGKDPELKVVAPVVVAEAPALQEIEFLRPDCLPKIKAEKAWLYRAGVGV